MKIKLRDVEVGKLFRINDQVFMKSMVLGLEEVRLGYVYLNHPKLKGKFFPIFDNQLDEEVEVVNLFTLAPDLTFP